MISRGQEGVCRCLSMKLREQRLEGADVMSSLVLKQGACRWARHLLQGVQSKVRRSRAERTLLVVTKTLMEV